ncbi:MAG: amino acid racemase, partial [Bacillota bacterium]
MVKTLGVIGGMGPQATVDFFQKVLDNTKASRDQDHIHVIIDSNPKTPDRTEAILGVGESPLKTLVNSAVKFQLMGADLLAMPCNTAHYFYDDIVKFIDIPFINMIDEVSATVRVRDHKATRVGLLAT